MTGYGRAAAQVGRREVTVEMRAVNHRYFDCTVRTPRLYTFLDEPVKALIAKSVSRGKIEVYITVDQTQGETLSVSLNRSLLDGYLSAARGAAGEYGLDDDLTLTAAVRFPDVFTVVREREDTEAFQEAVLKVAGEAVGAFEAMRKAEGGRMKADILRVLGTVGGLVAEIEQRYPQVIEEYRGRMRARMEEVLSGAGYDESRVIQEAAIFADRTAVGEEIVRLRSHISGLRSMLEKGGPTGKKCDFLIQEFNREANTIGSKANDAPTASLVVELKSEIEKMREQVQNIE